MRVYQETSYLLVIMFVMKQRAVGLIFIPIFFVAFLQFAHATSEVIAADTAADAQCPKGGESGGVISGYYPDEPRNSDFTDQGKKYHNLYGQPCSGPVVKAFCKAADFCDANISGSQCNDNGTWGACTATKQQTSQVAQNGAPTAPAYGGGNTSPVPSSATTNGSAPVNSAAANTNSQGNNGGSLTSSANVSPSSNAAQSNLAGSMYGTTQAPQAPVSPAAPAQSVSAQPTSIGPTQTYGSTQTSAAPTSQPAESSFAAGPSLSSAGTSIAPTGSPFTSPASSYSAPSQTSYTPTIPTFNAGSGFSGSPTITASSPLTNFVSSVGNLNSFFSYLTSVFTPSFAPAPTSVPVVQNPAQANPTIVNVTAGPAPQISKDSFSAANSSVGLSWVQQPSSFIDLIKGNGQTLSPIDIATIVDSLNEANTSTRPLVTVTPSNSVVQSLLQQQPAASLAVNSAINLPVPQIDSLALNTVNGLENYQNVPEQFYIEEASLAQAQSDYTWLQAQIAAWQSAQQAGVCDSSCENALAVLENEVPNQYQQVQQLQAQVDAGPSAAETTTASSTSATSPNPDATVQVPGAGQPEVVASESSTLQTPVPSEGAPYYVKQNDEWCDQYSQCIPASAFQPAPSTQIVPTTSVFASATTTVSAPENPVTAIVQAVQGWIGEVASLFTPNTASTNPTGQSCSLFKSLFGGCTGGW